MTSLKPQPLSNHRESPPETHTDPRRPGSGPPSPHTLGNKAARVLWALAWALLYRPSPKILHGWRRFLLRAFGANIGRGAHPHPSVKIWAPWNLQMGDHSCLGPHVDCYSVARIALGAHTTVSQYTFLCTATHNIDDPALPLVTAPILIGPRAWIAADVYLAPGVNVGEGAVVGVRSSVFDNVPPWTVVAGHPAKPLRKRTQSHPPAPPPA